MLVLSRRPMERIRLTVPPSAAPTEVWVTLVDFGNAEYGSRQRRARLGFIAADAVQIMREENLPPAERLPEGTR